MKNFEYVKAKSLKEAIHLLERYGGKAHLLAGGTDILVKMKQRQLSPEILVDIKEIPELRGIEYRQGSGMKIGALTTIREIEVSSVVQETLPVLAYAGRMLGSVQIRNRATIGGNLCNALPSADMGPYLIGMKARVLVAGPMGEHPVLVEELFAGSGQNSLGSGEVVTAIEIPAWSPNARGAYIKHAIKNAVDVAIVSVGVVVVTDPLKKVIEEARIVLGAVGPRPIRPKGAEEFIKGKPIDDQVIRKAGELASMEAKPRSTIEYKTQMVEVLTRRAMMQALDTIPRGY